MAKAVGVLTHPGGGFTSGWVGDFPIDQAIAIVREKRMKFDRPSVGNRDEGVMMLLAGLGVGSISELAELVRAGRVAKEKLRTIR